MPHLDKTCFTTTIYGSRKAYFRGCWSGCKPRRYAFGATGMQQVDGYKPCRCSCGATGMYRVSGDKPRRYAFGETGLSGLNSTTTPAMR
jgi:hypothetical protein